MDYKDLKDSYLKLGEAVEELANEGQILVIRNKDGNPRVLFYNEMDYNTPIDPEFQKMWAEITIPDETDLPKHLENGLYWVSVLSYNSIVNTLLCFFFITTAGLKTMEVFEKKVVAEVKCLVTILKQDNISFIL